MEQKIGFGLTLPDPAMGGGVDIKLWGTVQRTGEPGPGDAHVNQAMRGAAMQVLAGALHQQQVAMPTLSHSLAHFAPQIVQQANAQLASVGVQIQSAQLECSVPQSATQPAAAAIAAAPTPMESVANSFANNVADEVASSVPTGVNVKVGGFKVGIGSGGVDTGSLAEQAKDKVKSTILWYVGAAAILGLVSICCIAAIAYKIVFP